MSALEEDIGKLISRSDRIMRCSYCSKFSTCTFHPVLPNASELARPRKKSRSEAMSIGEQFFRLVGDSVRSIVPSYMSSRFSIMSSDRVSIRSTATAKLRYVPFSFDNDLFTSYVYKCNYRPAPRSKPPRLTPVGDQSTAQQPNFHGTGFLNPQGALPDEEYSQKLFGHLEAMPMFFRAGIDLAHENSLEMTTMNKDLLRSSTHDKKGIPDFAPSLHCLRQGAGIATLFVDCKDWLRLSHFMRYVYDQDDVFFVVLMRHIALSCDQLWLRQFIKAFYVFWSGFRSASAQKIPWSGEWVYIDALARFSDTARALANGPSKTTDSASACMYRTRA
ncbi:hypothetical protein K458DRAFT_490925 [Lentithecium fluviatile CBS 122367]|uniref:Uncharacterized protein n=1 Tax=Lentithecium fluviatile CBS 122367 TaxID=1168545 RepID=A0A6G1ILS4_9PLEO|nr:hypothetical protein K458DRAFT_490925 [Lentithecium fluviatile CBS 122367]